MQISFYGAAGEVTGACTLLEQGKFKILVDCGMFQGSHFNEDKNNRPLGFDPKSLTAVIVTHAHLDHTGRLPLLIKKGYGGFFYATPATIELTRLILEDAVEVMEENSRKYGTPVLYNLKDVAEACDRFKSLDYYEELILKPGWWNKIIIKFYEAGHIFGSVFAEIKIGRRKIVFSGDIGNVNAAILRETDNLPDKADLLICESTYGNRQHEISDNPFEVVEKIVSASMRRGGVLMIPAFSLERTQELLYRLNDFVDRRRELPRVPIFLDSPLAIKATAVYKKYPRYYDEEAKRLMEEGENFFDFSGLKLCLTRGESESINHVPAPKIIIAGAGMMNGGRIQHHAIRYLSDKNNTLLIIGYQAEGTLGRKILDGHSSVKIFGETIPVKAYVKAVGSLSAHADQRKLLDWIKSGRLPPKRIILNHGEPKAAAALGARLKEEIKVKVEMAGENKKIKV